MSLVHPFWSDDKQAPYAMFLSIIEDYVHPEEPDLEALQELAKRDDLPTLVTFKNQFREVIANASVLPEDALSTAADYGDGTDEAFLASLA